MKIAVSVSMDAEETVFRQFNVKPETDQDLKEAIADTVAFLKECHDEINQEGSNDFIDEQGSIFKD